LENASIQREPSALPDLVDTLGSVRQKLEKFLSQQTQPMTPRQIAITTGLNENTVRRELQRMLKDGFAKKDMKHAYSIANEKHSAPATQPQIKAPVPQAMIAPPTCPGCGQPLYRVIENPHEIYDFDPKTGTYDHQSEGDDMSIKCSNCGENVDEVFPDGACNFSSPAQLTTSETSLTDGSTSKRRKNEIDGGSKQ
jgi:hypothetical protein